MSARRSKDEPRMPLDTLGARQAGREASGERSALTHASGVAPLPSLSIIIVLLPSVEAGTRDCVPTPYVSSRGDYGLAAGRC